MVRFVVGFFTIAALFAIAPFSCAQNFPAFQWIQEVDGSGLGNPINVVNPEVLTARSTTTARFQE
jgi:hypothetical protein